MSDDVLDLLEENDDWWEGIEAEFETEGYNSKTGEYHWLEMSYNSIPKKTNFFYFEEEPEEDDDLFG
jgi:hypothetical protein